MQKTIKKRVNAQYRHYEHRKIKYYILEKQIKQLLFLMFFNI